MRIPSEANIDEATRCVKPVRSHDVVGLLLDTGVPFQYLVRIHFPWGALCWCGSSPCHAGRKVDTRPSVQVLVSRPTSSGSVIYGYGSYSFAHYPGFHPGHSRVSGLFDPASSRPSYHFRLSGHSLPCETMGALRPDLSLDHGVMERLLAGDKVDPEEYYFRTTPKFETGAQNYQWLNRTIAVATGERRASEVIITVYEVS